MSRRYHINPKLGIPSVCRAEKGKCPYGGASGNENHFDTFSEAQKRSQEIFEETYRILPSSVEDNKDEIMQEIEQQRKVKKDIIDKLPKSGEFEITKAIMETDNEDVVMGVIEGEIYPNSNWTYTSVALQNPNISQKFLNEALFHYPGEFDISTRRWLVLNRSLSHEDLLSIVENENEDMTMRAVAFRNPNISKEYVDNIIENDTERLEKLPYSMIIYSHNSNAKTESVRDDAVFFRTRELEGISKAESLATNYIPWENIYRKEIKEENESKEGNKS